MNAPIGWKVRRKDWPEGQWHCMETRPEWASDAIPMYKDEMDFESLYKAWYAIGADIKGLAWEDFVAAINKERTK